MTRRIYKYPLALEAEQHVALPPGARLLAVGAQGAAPVLWADCDDAGEYTGRKIVTVTTGGEPPTDAVYVGTFSLWPDSASPFVGHVYDGGEHTLADRMAEALA